MPDAQLALPHRRDLNKPYFILRTPDGLKTYFFREYTKALFNRKEPLTRFLARADTDKSPASAVLYDYSGLDTETLKPLDFLAESELAAFAEACEAFYTKAHPQTQGVTPFEKELRAHFRLPDPEKEPDAYWLYGPSHDRRLLILWGCEFEHHSSLPLMALKGVAEGRNVLDCLRERLMPWSGKQLRAVDLAREKNEPLARFLATPNYDANGELHSATTQAGNVPVAQLKPAKFIPQAQVDALEEAGQQFYRLAHPDNENSSDFEKELRKSLRLPDPQRHPQAYRLGPKGLTILVSGEERRAETLPIAAVPEVGIPAKEEDERGNTYVPSTVVSHLRTKARPWKTYALYGGIAAACVVLLAAFLLARDTAPPELLDVIARNDPTTVRLQFDDAIEEASLFSDAERAFLAAQAAGELVTPPAERHMVLRTETNRTVDILDRGLDPADPTAVLLTVPALEEIDYELDLANIEDTSGNRMEALSEVEFDYRDTEPPVITRAVPQGGNTKGLVLIFDEPLEPETAGNPANYEIDGFRFTAAEVEEAFENSVTLTATTDFEDLARYQIIVDGVSDRSRERNRTDDLVFDFNYLDDLPPQVRTVLAQDKQIHVWVEFNEQLDPGSAQEPGHFVIRRPDDSLVETRQARLLADNRTVQLVTEALENGITYTLEVFNVADASRKQNVMGDEQEPTAFNYTGRPDTRNPTIARIRATGRNNNIIIIAFDEPVDPRPFLANPEAFTLSDPTYRITGVEALGNDNERFKLDVNPPLAPGQQYRLTVAEVVDNVGNRSEAVQSRLFEPAGARIGSINYVAVDSVRLSPDGLALDVFLTEAVTEGSALNPNSYRLEPSVPLASVNLIGEDAKTVRLSFDQALRGDSYTLTIRDLALLTAPSRVQNRVSTTFNGLAGR